MAEDKNIYSLITPLQNVINKTNNSVTITVSFYKVLKYGQSRVAPSLSRIRYT